MVSFQELFESTPDGGKITYSQLLNTIEWLDRRNEIIKRDNNSCSNCGTSSTFNEYHNGRSINFWFGEEENCWVKDEKGNMIESYLPKIILADKGYSLQVHHKYYILGKLPWEYIDEALITYCNWCHLEWHQRNKIKYFTTDSQVEELDLTPCSNCHGTGYLPQYSHVEGGRCFHCNGERFIEFL